MKCPLCGGDVWFWQCAFVDGSIRTAYGCKSCCVMVDPFLSTEADAGLVRRFKSECAKVKYCRENPPVLAISTVTPGRDGPKSGRKE